METVLLVIHLMIVSALVGLVLIQRSEGGALGIGGGGNFMASRGSGNVLTRTTTYLAIGFFITSIALTLLAKANQSPDSVLDGLLADPVTEDGTARPAGNLLDLIRPATTVPTDDAGAVTPAPAAETPVVPNEGVTTPAVGETPAPAAAEGATPVVPNEGAAVPAGDTPAAPTPTPVVPP